jgi:hypothetical protein
MVIIISEVISNLVKVSVALSQDLWVIVCIGVVRGDGKVVFGNNIKAFK